VFAIERKTEIVFNSENADLELKFQMIWTKGGRQKFRALFNQSCSGALS